MDVLRTPETRFTHLPQYNFKPNYLDIPAGDGGLLRVHYLDEGDPSSVPVLLMHGEPSWCFLYRKMIPLFVDAGFRVIAPDLVGFGRSDKPSRQSDYTYQRHLDWMQSVIDQLKLNKMTLVCQDWGGLIGLRLVSNQPDRFKRVIAANTGLPTGDHPMPKAFLDWRDYSQTTTDFHVGGIVQLGCSTTLPPEVIAAYDAPFPDDRYKMGARIFPALVPISPDTPEAQANRRAWEVLSKFEKPFLTAFSDKDPITKGGEALFQKRIPGAKGMPHTTIQDGGHFLQEDQGEALARVSIDFIIQTA